MNPHFLDFMPLVGQTKIPTPLSDIAVEGLKLDVPWINRDGAPRDECFMSDTTDTYTYGSGKGLRTYSPVPYTNLLKALRETVRDITGTHYEACFLNLYVDEHKHLGWHADDSPSIDHKYGIVIASFGAEREIWFRSSLLDDADRVTLLEAGVRMGGAISTEVTKTSLPHGSLLMMPPGFQQSHQHRIPKASKKCGIRISLTFRKLKTL